MITRQRAYWISLFIVLVVTIYNHPFLFIPLKHSYCYFTLFNHSSVYRCTNAHYYAYGYSFSLAKLLFIENLGLNNIVLPLMIISTNIVLIIGLRRRSYQRRNHLGAKNADDWRERSVLIYMILSSVVFVILTSPIGILGVWERIHEEQMPTNNLSVIFDLMEIVHHCSHFPILLMTSSLLRKKTLQHGLQRLKSASGKPPIPLRLYTQRINQQETLLSPPHPNLRTSTTSS